MLLYKTRTIVFLIVIIVIEILSALFAGLGWFLLVETLRRLLITIPSIYIPAMRFLRGPEFAENQLLYIKQPNYRWRLGVKYITLLIWAVLTIIAFEKVNVTLIYLFK